MAVASDVVTSDTGGVIDGLAGAPVQDGEVASSPNDKQIKEKKPPADAKKQVFAGNLAFSTTEEDLRALFSQAGPVADVQIISRGSRSLGYCFITYESEESAQKAVATLNKQVVAGREVNLESAKPQEELAALKEAKAAQRRERNAKKKAEKEAAAAAAGVTPAEATEGSAEKREKKKRSRKPKSASGRRPRADDGEEADKDAVVGEDGTLIAAANGGSGAEGTASTAAKKKTRKSKSKKAAATAANGEGDAVAVGADGTTEKKPRERKPRVAKGPPTGEPSPTLLFVANLSFEVDDDELKEAFTSEGIQVVTATVVKRKFGLKKSKGFGFVEVANQEEQSKALEKCSGKSVGGRAISLKVAIEGSKEQADEAAKDVAEAEAPAAAA